MPIRVLYVIDHLGYGGAELLLKNIVENTDTETVEAIVCALRTKPSAISIRNRVINLNCRRYSPLSVFAVAGLCKKHNVDIIHAHQSKSIITCLLASFICKKPVILHEHGGIYRKGLDFSIYRFLLRILHHRAAAIIANSQATSRELFRRSGINQDKIQVVHNVVDMDSFDISKISRETAREKLGISDKDFVVGYAGRLNPVKGVDILLQAFSLLLHQSADYLLLIAGDGPQRAFLEELTARLNISERVKFLGICDNVPELMAAFDVGVVPSRQEPFGIVVLELMRMKVPVVSSRRDGLAELVSDGVTGLVVPNNVPEEICRCVHRLAIDADLRQRLAEAAYTFSNQFGLKEYLQKLRSVYTEVLDRRTSRTNAPVSFFAKVYQDPQAAKAEFSRSLEVSEKLKQRECRYLRVPRPIRVCDNTVYFEKVLDCMNLRRLICRWNVNRDIMYDVGRALAELHQAINPRIEDLRHNMNIHGDFWAANVLYSISDNHVYIVDFEPPGFAKPGREHSYGSAYDDLSPMIISLEVKYPLHRAYLLMRRKNRELSAGFLKGYEEAIGMKIDHSGLAACLEQWLMVYTRVFENKNVLSRIFWTRVFRRFVRFYSKQKG